MEAAVATLTKPQTSAVRVDQATGKPVRRGRFDTLEKFIRWKPEDGYKYEWNNGIIEKSPKMVTPATFFIVDKLVRLAQTTTAYSRGGQLITEPGTMTSATQLRIPDMGFYTQEQIATARKGGFPMPAFAIEFVSDHDAYKKVLRKLDEYFQAGVRVVWLVFPELERVYVHTSPVDVTICQGSRVCSAAPVANDFQIAAAELFA